VKEGREGGRAEVASSTQGSLHGLDDDRTLAHSQVVVRTPDGDLVGSLSGVSDGELGCQSVDVVEVSVGPEEGREGRASLRSELLIPSVKMDL